MNHKAIIIAHIVAAKRIFQHIVYEQAARTSSQSILRAMRASGASTVLLLVREMALGRTKSRSSKYCIPNFLIVEFTPLIGVPNVKGCLLSMSKFPLQEQAVGPTVKYRTFALRLFF